MRVEKRLTINGIVVELVKKLGLDYDLLKQVEPYKSGYGERYFIAYNGVVMFEITAVADGDDMACVSSFDVKFMGEAEGEQYA